MLENKHDLRDQERWCSRHAAQERHSEQEESELGEHEGGWGCAWIQKSTCSFN